MSSIFAATLLYISLTVSWMGEFSAFIEASRSYLSFPSLLLWNNKIAEAFEEL